MAWTAPMTAIAGSVFTASQFNTFIRDNFNECPTSKAANPGSYFVTTATNQVGERIAKSDFISTQESSSSTSQVDLATLGPVVSVTTSTKALVHLYCNMFNSAVAGTWMEYDVSGATTVAASDNAAIQLSATGGQRLGATILHDNLNPGVNVFTAKYRVSSGTGSWSARRIAVQPF